MIKTIITMELRYEQDLVLCRKRVRLIAELLSFDRQEQTRIATAVSEIVRNAFEYAGGGMVEMGVSNQAHPAFLVTIRDSGPGISNLKAVLNGQYVSRTGLGLGIIGAKRLMEHFEIDSNLGGGTRITLGKPIPPVGLPVSANVLRRITDELAKKGVDDPLHEVAQQNQELLSTMQDLQAQKMELAKLNRELEETNRGVVALYAELDEKANSLKRASEAKTSFLSNMTHEFRTPLNSIIGLSRVALSDEDGELNPEHKKQVSYILKSAETLSELVNDLLDIAKVEAGKIDIKVQRFHVIDLLGGLKGVLKPLVISRPNVNLFFDEQDKTLILDSDEGKIAQILRNLISNALKYTENGHVRVNFEGSSDGKVRFSVSDTGIGIAEQDQERIFDEFIQIESPLQKRCKGTGLGLSLSRKLATLLGGSLSVSSVLHQGSVFTLEIPSRIESLSETSEEKKSLVGLRVETDELIKAESNRPRVPNGEGTAKILIIDDEEIARYLLKGLMPDGSLTFIEAVNGFEGIRLAIEEQPNLIFLDLQMPNVSGFYVLDLLKSNPLTRTIPVIVYTAMTLSQEEQNKLAPNVITIIPKEGPSWQVAKERIRVALLAAHIAWDEDLKEVEIG